MNIFFAHVFEMGYFQFVGFIQLVKGFYFLLQDTILILQLKFWSSELVNLNQNFFLVLGINIISVI